MCSSDLIRMEMGSPKEFGSRAESRFSHGECEHVATHHDAQRSQVHRSILRWMRGGRIPKRKTLSELLQEYESQTERFRDHTNFQEFFKIQVEGSKQQDADRFFLSTFEGSPTCSARAWVKELDSYLQQHHISEDEAIIFAALHFRGKAHAWWIFESFSLKNANTSSYARFIEIGRAHV